MKKNLVIVVLIMALLLVGTIQAAAQIRVGANFELTGVVATFGSSSVNGIKLAFDEANAQGGVHGQQLVLIEADNKSDNAEATNMATKLILQDRVVALLGPVTSTNAMAAGSVAQSMGIPMISPTATNPSVTEIGDFIFRACFIDSFQGAVMADFAYNELGSRDVAIFMDNASDYSRGLVQFFKARFIELGGNIVAEEAYLARDTEFRPQLTRIRGTNPDMIYIPGYYEEQGAIARQAREMGIDIPLTGADGWDSAMLVEIAGPEALNDIFFTNHYSPDDQAPIVQSFVTSYQERYGQTPDALAALGYDGAWLMIEALRAANSTDGSKIRDALAAIEYEGIGGTIFYDENRNPVKAAVIIELVNGQQVFRDTVQP